MAHRKLKHVRQQTSTCCGPASVAIVARCSLKTAIRAIFDEDRATYHWTCWPDIKKGLDVLGLEYGQKAKRVSDWRRIPTTAIVNCSRLKDGTSHFVVYDPTKGDGLVYDPLRALPVGLKRVRRKPFSYLAVTL
jgi:hypothetical protein